MYFNINKEKSEIFKNTKKDENIKKREELTYTASLKLIERRNTNKLDLAKKNEHSRSFFDDCMRKDYVKEKAVQDIMKREHIKSSMKAPKKEHRNEISDFYNMNEKLIQQYTAVNTGEQDQHFQNIKKLSILLKKDHKNEKKSERLSIPKPLNTRIRASIDRLSKPKIK